MKRCCSCCLLMSMLASGLIASVAAGAAAPVTLLFDGANPQVQFACEEISSALAARGHSARQSDWTELDKLGGARIILAPRSNSDVIAKMQQEGAKPIGALRGEGYSLRISSRNGLATYWVIGADAAGLMYGGLELAEVVRLSSLQGITDVDHNPYMAMRGTKFNIPLDARSPSYSDLSDAGQKNIAEMWSFDFWREYIDNLARHRYNFISLWSLHPFPSLVKVPDYPDVALDDVKRSTIQWEENYDLSGRGFDSPEILGSLETLRKMTIDEKIAFWRKVMRYAKDRNIDFYVVTWNIFVNGTYGKYGITDDIDNPTTIDYFRKSVRQMFLTYPDLRGIGLTTGENMPKASFSQKEDWAFKTYAQGVLDVAEQQPGRKITLIHRQHQTGARDIARRFAPLIEHKDIEFVFSFKYAQAHAYSSTKQIFHPDFVKDIQAEGDLRTIWTLRNDDNYYFRWGAPDFVRQFIANIPREVSRGFYFGSDGYIWGREFTSTEPQTPRQIEVAKNWYPWMIWGRLAYDPNLPNERFVGILQQRYPGVSGRDLFTVWQEAAMIYPKTTGFHWGSLDFQWYIEACRSRPEPAQTASGFHDVNRFISLPPHGGTGYVSIPDYVESLAAGKSGSTAGSGTTPIEVSNQIHAHADKALKILAGLSHGRDKELRLTLGDITAMAYLGKYYAHKIRGATELALHRKSAEPQRQKAAVEELTKAAQYWRLYASTALAQYENPLWGNRVGYCDWRKLFDEVLHDIEIAGGPIGLASMPPTPGGTVLEAEAAASSGVQKAAGIAGHSGAGYVDFNAANATRSLDAAEAASLGTPALPRRNAIDGVLAGWVEWTFDAPKAGTYILELRYIRQQGRDAARITLNGKDAGEIVLWTTGGASTWAWDRKPVTLNKGGNIIRLSVTGPLLIDHLNIL